MFLMVLKNIFIGNVGWADNDFHIWKIWPFFFFFLWVCDVDCPILLHCTNVMDCDLLLVGKGFWSSSSSLRLPCSPSVAPGIGCTLSPAASELEGAFSSTDNKCYQEETLTGFYCTPVFEAPSVISFTTEDVVQMLVQASFIFTSWMKPLLLYLNFFNK